MGDMVMFFLYLLFASLNFGWAAKDLHERRYMVFGFELAFGIIFVSAAAARFISKTVL